MKTIAFALFYILVGSFGNYFPPAEEIQSTPRSVSSQTETETENSGDQNQPKRMVTQKIESMRPGFAGRESHRAIRSKSVPAPNTTHFGLSTTIPGRVSSLGSLLFTKSRQQPMLVFFTNMTDNQFAGEEHHQKQEPSPRSVSTQTETTLTDSQPTLVFFTNMTDHPFAGEEHHQKQEPTDSIAIEICLTSEEKKLYDLIMAYRKSKRLPAIPYSAKLSKVAQTHVRDLEANYNYENASTCNPHSWSEKGAWTSCCYTSDHKKASCMWTKPKEIAGYEGYGYEIAYYSSAGANATEGLEGWKKSPGHNPLLVNLGTWSKVKWQAIGIGIYGQYGVVWFGEEADESKMKVCK